MTSNKIEDPKLTWLFGLLTAFANMAKSNSLLEPSQSFLDSLTFSPRTFNSLVLLSATFVPLSISAVQIVFTELDLFRYYSIATPFGKSFQNY